MARIIIGLAIATLAFAPTADAEEQGPSGSTAEQAGKADSPAVSSAPPVYQLPKVGKPRHRVGGGRRGPIEELPEIVALVPDHVGLTISAQPTLYWYLSEGAKGDMRFELTLIDEESIDPLVEKRMSAPSTPGLQRIRLEDYGVKLETGQEYEWYVDLVPNEDQRSQDVVSSGWIERVAAPDGISDRLASADPAAARALYGEAGLWYDVLDASYQLARKNPDNAAHRQQLAALLQQIGLPETAIATD